MGRTTTIAKYEITQEIKDLQELAQKLSFQGYHINVDITQDLVVVNNIHRFNRTDGKAELIRLLEASKISQGSTEFPDREQEAREAKALAKQQKKHREPGAPTELKTVIRRAKRIYKKAIIKNIPKDEAVSKASDYLEKKLIGGDDLDTASEIVLKYIEAN